MPSARITRDDLRDLRRRRGARTRLWSIAMSVTRPALSRASVAARHLAQRRAGGRRAGAPRCGARVGSSCAYSTRSRRRRRTARPRRSRRRSRRAASLRANGALQPIGRPVTAITGQAGGAQRVQRGERRGLDRAVAWSACRRCRSARRARRAGAADRSAARAARQGGIATRSSRQSLARGRAGAGRLGAALQSRQLSEERCKAGATAGPRLGTLDCNRAHPHDGLVGELDLPARPSVRVPQSTWSH